jgi:hypothetical protein
MGVSDLPHSIHRLERLPELDLGRLGVNFLPLGSGSVAGEQDSKSFGVYSIDESGVCCTSTSS